MKPPVGKPLPPVQKGQKRQEEKKEGQGLGMGQGPVEEGHPGGKPFLGGLVGCFLSRLGFRFRGSLKARGSQGR